MECKDLTSGRNNIIYCARKRENTCVHFEVIASFGDQPERRSMSYMMLCSSTHSSRYEYATNMGAIALYFPSCEKCFTSMKEETNFIKDDKKFKNYVNWNLMRASPLLNYEAPKDYPKEMARNKNMRTIELIFKVLTSAVNMVRKNYWQGIGVK